MCWVSRRNEVHLGGKAIPVSAENVLQHSGANKNGESPWSTKLMLLPGDRFPSAKNKEIQNYFEMGKLFLYLLFLFSQKIKANED